MSTKTFDNVKVKVAFTTATTRANIITGENISTMFGKLSKWYTSFNDVVWTGDADTVSGFTVGTNVPADAEFTDTVYTHPTTAGNKHIPSGGASGQILKWSSSGTAKWASEYSYTHPTSGVTAGTYRSVTVDANGHVTAGSNPTLTVAQGGTGGTTANAAAFNLIGDPVVSETALSDDIKFAFYYATPSTSNGALYAKKASSVWTYIKGKADTVYAPKSHTHSISNITNLQTTLDSKLNASLKGAASGLAELDSSGKVPSSQLPSYVDDVIEGYLSSGKFYKESAHTTQITGETGKIYVDLSTSKTYRWSGSAFAEISSSLALGTTSSTAYRGDRGLIAYNHSQVTSGNPHNVTKSDVGLGNVENKSSATIRGELTKANVTTALGYTPPTQDTVYTHPTYTAKTGVPTANQTPAFGGTFTVTQPVSDATGHITAMNSRTITIPATAMTGATASAAGTKGLVPAPAKGKQDTFLRGDGTWVAPLRQTVMNQPSSTPTETPWFKVASATLTTTSAHIFLTLAVSSGMVGTQVGILHVKVATGTTVGTNMSATAKWLNPTGIELGDFVLTYTETADTSVKYELWCKLDRQWRTYIFSVINEGSRTTADIRWDLEEDKTAGVATYGTPTGVVESSYISNDSPAKMTENTADSEQYVFFNDSTVDGTLGYDSSFVFNPSKNTILITNPGGTRTTKYSGQGVAINTDSNTSWANGINYYTADGSTQLAALGAYGTASMTSDEFDTDGYLYMGKTYSNPWLKVAKSLSSMYSDFVISKTTPVLTINSGGSTEASVVLKRNGSSWRIMDASNGIFKIQNNWEDGAAVDWFDTFTMSTGGAATFESSVTATRFIGPASKIETVSSATKSYLLGTTTAPTSTVTGVTTTVNTKVYATDGTLYATKFSGSGASLTSIPAGNLTGTISADRLGTSGVTAGSYGPSADATPAHKGTISVPYITVDAKGRVTAASTKTITLPASGNTDTKVNVTLATTTKAYLLGVSTAPTSTAKALTAVSDTGVYLDTTAGKLTATSFAGSGASLTSLNASNISSGTLSADRLATSGATAGTYGESAAKTATHGGTISIPKITIDNKGRVTSASSITVTLPSDNNTDTKVTSTTTNPTSAKSYYPTFVTGATTGGVSINNGLQYQSLEGTTSADGYGILKLGNPTASGTAANKYGRLDIFSIGTSYGSIKQTSTNSAVTHWLPDVGGTLLNSGNYLNYKGHLRQNVMNQSSSTPAETPWFKIASMTLEGTSSHAFGTFAIANGMSAGDVGILHVKVATGSTAGTNLSATARWISKTRIDPSTFVVTYTETANTSVKYELWCKLTNQWRTYISSIINEGARTQANIVWELSEDTTAGSATYGTPTGFSESAHTIDEGPMATTSNSANSEQTLFFNDSTVDGTLGYDSSLVFNPSTNTIYVTNPGGTRRSGYGGNGMSIRADSSTTWACGVNYYTSDGATQIGAIGAYGVANATEAGYLYMGKTYSNPWLKVAEDQITGYADTVISKATPTLTLNSGGSTPPTIVLKRNGSSWRVMNESGAFVLKCDWDAENSTTTDWWQAFKISTSGAISGNGSGLTNLNASNITSGTLSSDRLPTVPITKGGTGGTTANAAAFNLIGDPVISETAIADTTKLAFYYATPSTSNGALYAKPASTLWTYIEPKIEAAYQPLKKKTVTLPATAGWYRIASSWEGINRCHGIFTIEGTVSGRHTTATFTAQSSYGNANSTSITVLTASQYGNPAISKVRIVYHTTYSGNYAYLEVYNPAAAATKVTTNIDSSIGWQLIDVVAGSIPSGYSNKEVTLSNNTMVATTFSGTASKVTSAMAAPTTSTSYGIAFHTGNTAGSKSLLNNAGIRCAVANGVAGATDPGLGYIYLGNNKATGTADNQKGGILMYSDTTYAGYITAPSLTARRDYALPNASGTIALTSTANMVKQADLDVRYDPETQTTNNAGLRLPLAIGSKNTNPDNNFKDGEGQREINIETGNFGINLTGLAWIETNTTSGNVGTPNVPYATICSTGFRVTDNDIGGFYGNATSATTLKNQPTINGVTFAGDNNISLGKVLYEGFTINADGSITDNNGTDTSVDLNDDPMNYDALYVETSLGAYWVIPKDEVVNAAFTYATTPNPGGNSTAVYGTVSIYVNGMELSSTVSKSRMTGSTSSVTAASVTVNNTIRRVIGLHLV